MEPYTGLLFPSQTISLNSNRSVLCKKSKSLLRTLGTIKEFVVIKVRPYITGAIGELSRYSL